MRKPQLLDENLAGTNESLVGYFHAGERASCFAFLHRHAARLEMFLDGPSASPRDAVYIVFACEKVRQDYPVAAPDVTESERTETFRLVTLDALVRMKLTSFRDKDRTHLRDLIDVGLLDHSWFERVPVELAPRLQSLLNDPEG